MKKQTKGNMVFLDGEEYYKIENYDFMTDFFMTITSSSDIWNFCWAQGGISAGRKNCEYSIFPYYTSDKIRDTENSTGALTIIKIKNEGRKGTIWQPFENLSSTGKDRYNDNLSIQRNLYKNQNGSKIWFEEINLAYGISFRYGWTSSAKYGLVKMSRIENLTDKKISLEILDGARNIMCSSSQSEIQNSKSNLLDAYKKSEVLDGSKVALFSLSSILTDKAEPSESLVTNVSWFSTNDPVILSENAVKYFIEDKTELVIDSKEMNGKRPECYIVRKVELLGKSAECWEQVFDVNYDTVKLVKLLGEISERQNAVDLLIRDIAETEKKLEENLRQADGIQTTKNRISDLHHRTNVMFNIMRGGIFNDEGKISVKDFIDFVDARNKNYGKNIRTLLDSLNLTAENTVTYHQLKAAISTTNEPQFSRLFREYLPLTFSRRHGDPSRPWNRFNIDLLNEDGTNRIYYEGNWRDIFQNWESLLWSYPTYAENVISVFINAITIDGFNPYRISRDGIDWEVPEQGNPWAQYGYWGDHQVIYLQKFLEFLSNLDKNSLAELLNEKSFSTANLPYRLKEYSQIVQDPRNTITFDYDLNKKLKTFEKTYGSDARLVLDEKQNVQLTTMATKLIQIILAKLLNHIPEAGIWMNTQRPEWNDANNALAGYGTSVVTMCYLYRMLKFLEKFISSENESLKLNKTVFQTFKKTEELYKALAQEKNVSSKYRLEFTNKAGSLFEEELKELYAKGYSEEYISVPSNEISSALHIFAQAVRSTIEKNRRQDGLYHAYNSVCFTENGLEIVNLKLMLEGQVAVLSSGFLSKEEAVVLTQNLRKSDLFEEFQHSYMLYPNTKLKGFMEKNNIREEELSKLGNYIRRTGKLILIRDSSGIWHFNSVFRNADVLKDFISKLPEEQKPSEAEMKELLALYEKNFNHQTFTGRSGTFYAYEGLGCIYWHMVSKLLLAVQENITEPKDELISFYKDVKKGLGAAKTPDEYGAFPFDPYSHTPYRQGAQQPGMTGQVKEEILTRFGELGIKIQDGKALFEPINLEKSEFQDGKIEFTWCGIPVTYESSKENSVTVNYTNENSETFSGNTIPSSESKKLFSRTGLIKSVIVRL